MTKTETNKLLLLGELQNTELWDCLYDLVGESDGSLTLDQFSSSDNNSESGINFKNFKFSGSLN